jgi:hypothetical protein
MTTVWPQGIQWLWAALILGGGNGTILVSVFLLIRRASRSTVTSMTEQEIIVTSDMTAKVTDAEIGETGYRAYCSTYAPITPHQPWGELPDWQRYAWNVAAAEIYVLAVQEALGPQQHTAPPPLEG